MSKNLTGPAATAMPLKLDIVLFLILKRYDLHCILSNPGGQLNLIMKMKERRYEI
jgi:hypothetical protein